MNFWTVEQKHTYPILTLGRARKNFKGVLLCFFTFWILVRVQCVCLGIKRSTKLQISKSTPKGDILFLKKSLFKNYNELGLQSCFPVFVTSQILNPAYRNSNGWGGWRTLGWALHVSKSKTGAGVFISLFSESFGCHFHFILHIQGAGHIIRISSKSWFISLIPFKKWNLYNVYIHSTQTDIFQVFISFNFDDYNWQLMKTPNSVSQKIRILLKTNTKKGFLEILANWKVWTWKVWACTALNT